MIIKSRPYLVSSKVENIQKNLNEIYDRNIDSFISSICENPWKNPSLKISVTNTCNLSCTYCYDKFNQPPFQQPLNMDPIIVNQIFEKYPDPSYVFVMGGEPFLNPKTVMAILERCPSHLSISTNGQVLNASVNDILKKIRKRNEIGLETTLQISCEEGGLTIERNTQDIENKIYSFSSICGPYIKTKYTLTEPNVSDIKNIAQWYWDRDLPVEFDYADGGYGPGHEVNISEENRIKVFEFGLETLRQSFEDWIQDENDLTSIKHVRTILKPVYPYIYMQLKLREPIWSMCGILGHSLYIGPNGEMHPCHRCRIPNLYGKLGDETIDKVKNFHRKLGPIMKNNCHDCIWRGTCGGICPAVIYNYGFEKLEGRCKFIGALRDAFWEFLVNDDIISNTKIKAFLNNIVHNA